VSDTVPTDHRLPWVQPAFLAEAAGWIDLRLAENGIERTGDLEQTHVRWWSTVIRVRSTEGELWFKANAGIHAFEAALLAILGRIQPGSVPELVASDPARGWLLMRHGGDRLREQVRSATDLGHWVRLLPLYAELQLACAPHVGELLAAGVPDERLATLTAHFEALLAEDELLRVGYEDGLTQDEVDRLHAFVPELAELCRRLAGFGVPETLQHDDLHDGNIFIRNGRYLFFDWGDSCVSHPFHTLVVTLRAAAWRLELPPGGPDLVRLREAYLEPFAGYGSPAELAGAADLAHVTGSAARTLAWRRFLNAREAEFREPDAETIPYGLRLLLARGPIGSWG
jgi:phosphotransferase family enzyme